jgi:hypothetical protein
MPLGTLGISDSERPARAFARVAVSIVIRRTAEFFQQANGGRFATLCERRGPLIALEDHRCVLSAEDKAEKFESYFLPFRSLFVAL